VGGLVGEGMVEDAQVFGHAIVERLSGCSDVVAEIVLEASYPLALALPEHFPSFLPLFLPQCSNADNECYLFFFPRSYPSLIVFHYSCSFIFLK
jgi:hypothetical protein